MWPREASGFSHEISAVKRSPKLRLLGTLGRGIAYLLDRAVGMVDEYAHQHAELNRYGFPKFVASSVSVPK